MMMLIIGRDKQQQQQQQFCQQSFTSDFLWIGQDVACLPVD